MVIITTNMRKYLENPEKKGYNRTEYNKRINSYATDGLKDLKYLLEHAPEELKAEIFTSGNLKPLFRALFHVDTKTSFEERRRVLIVCSLLLDEIAQLRHEIPLLAPDAWKVLKETPSSDIEEIYGTKIIQALQIQAAKFT